MPQDMIIRFDQLSKRFGAIDAVKGLSATIQPGQVTGFLGPNGAGKTTSLRMLLGLVRPSAGTATIGGKKYAQLEHPLRTVGAVLEASNFHPGRTGYQHLMAYAVAADISKTRVNQVLEIVGLGAAALRKVGGYSLGMRQRLGLAFALMGDPGVLILDEPTNGLDPEGIRWVRDLLQVLAAEGRTVLVSSHILAEVQQISDSVLILAHGRLVYQGPLEDLGDRSEYATVVDSPNRNALADSLKQAGYEFNTSRNGFSIIGADPAVVGSVAQRNSVALSHLSRRGPALEEVFLELVNGTRVHPSAYGLPATNDAVEASTTIEGGAA